MVKIVRAIPKDDHSIDIELDNGKIGPFDVSPYLEKGMEKNNLEIAKKMLLNRVNRRNIL